MKKNKIFEIFMPVFLASVVYANDLPFYDSAYAIKTKEAIMLSQLLPKGDSLKMDISGDMTGKRSFFSSFSENKDPKWVSTVNINVDVDACINEETAEKIAAKGYKLKSRISDSEIVGYREAVKLLKENGARYIYVRTGLIKRSALAIWKAHEPMSYTQYLDMMKAENSTYTPAQLKAEHDKFMSDWNKEKPIVNNSHKNDETTDDTSDDIRSNVPFGTYFQMALTDRAFEKSNNRLLPDACFQNQNIKASDFFWLAGQVASLAIGVKGANAGNTNMASLGSNTSHAVDNTASLMQNGETASVDSKQLSLIALKTKLMMVGFIDKKYFEESLPHLIDYKTSGYIFPIDEVEEHLSHYINIPYRVKKITEY